jgi:hypothetical protein
MINRKEHTDRKEPELYTAEGFIALHEMFGGVNTPWRTRSKGGSLLSTKSVLQPTTKQTD